MPRFNIQIQYDGTRYKGWQLQSGVKTIQGELEKALKVLNKQQPIRVHGAGRTDTGVHALAQEAHFDFKTDMDSCELKNALNGNLPEDIQVRVCRVISPEFHARFSADKRSYVYRCRTDDFLLDRRFTWRTGILDIPLLNSAAEIIKGNHDFTSLSRNCNTIENRRCKVYESVWNGEGAIVNYTITANRFLHHMVRYLVGTMVEISRGKYSIDSFTDLLENPREKTKIFKAPSQGLLLQKVEYGHLS